MARSRAPKRNRQPADFILETPADAILEKPDTTLLDLLDRLLNKGVMATGDVTLGVAGIDLIYLRLSALLCAADRIFGPPPQGSKPRRRRTHRSRTGA